MPGGLSAGVNFCARTNGQHTEHDAGAAEAEGVERGLQQAQETALDETHGGRCNMRVCVACGKSAVAGGEVKTNVWDLFRRSTRVSAGRGCRKAAGVKRRSLITRRVRAWACAAGLLGHRPMTSLAPGGPGTGRTRRSASHGHGQHSTATATTARLLPHACAAENPHFTQRAMRYVDGARL